MSPARIKKYGVYRLYWNDGGFSLASVGGDAKGRLWFAPCNWISGPSFDWGIVKRAVYINLGPVRGTVVCKPRVKPARSIAALLRDIILLDGDESNPFDASAPPYVVPSLDAMAVRAARVLGTTREAVRKRARVAAKGAWR